jgi:hypothetical protein
VRIEIVRLDRVLGVLNDRVHFRRHAGSKLLRDVELRHAVELQSVSMVHWKIATEGRLAYRMVDVTGGLAGWYLGVPILISVVWCVSVGSG